MVTLFALPVSGPAKRRFPVIARDNPIYITAEQFCPILPLRLEPRQSILLSPRADAPVPPATDGVGAIGGRVALTERFARSARTGGRKNPIFYDDEVIGFGLRVRNNMRETFTLDYNVEGQTAAFRLCASEAAGPLSATSTRSAVLR
jgi:hypothetical protein